MWALFLSESKVVMWFLFSKHYRRTWGHTSNWIFSGESVCVLFLWVMCWFCACGIVCGGIWMCMSLYSHLSLSDGVRLLKTLAERIHLTTGSFINIR